MSKKFAAWMNGILKCSPGSVTGLPYRLAELRDDHLLGFAHLVGGRRQQEQREQDDPGLDDQRWRLHWLTSRLRHGLVAEQSLQPFDRQQRDDAARPLVHEHLGTQLREHPLHGLEMEPAPGDLGRAPVRLVDRLEPGGVTLCAVDALERVPFGLEDRLARLALRARNHLVVFGARLIDQPVALLLRLVHFVPGRLDRIGRRHVLQDDLLDDDAHLVLVDHVLEQPLRRGGDLLPAHGEHLGHRAVPHHLAHHRLVHAPERLREAADLEEVPVGIGHPVLHDPLDHGDVQIAGEHDRLVREALLRVPGPGGRLRRAESELFFELALDRHPHDLFDERQLDVETRLGRADVPSEAEHDADFLGLTWNAMFARTTTATSATTAIRIAPRRHPRRTPHPIEAQPARSPSPVATGMGGRRRHHRGACPSVLLDIVLGER